MKNLLNKVISHLTILFLISACGNESEKNKSSTSGGGEVREEEVAALDGSHIQGHYNAKFVTLNPHVNGTIPGSASFYRKEEKIFAYVRLFAGGPRAWHQQYVYEGTRCPNLNDDLNLDGFIDIVEAEKVLGKIIIPMDSDISTQNSGRRFFPLGDLSGYYHYERITNFNRFLTDLQSTDSDPSDDVRKLAADEPLRITGRAFMVLGIVETVQLPETVGTKGRHRAFQTLPIACGIFEKADQIPGDPYSDQIPGPIGDVIPGQDRPSNDVPGDTTDGDGTGTSTGTNDSDDGDGPVSDGDGNTSTTSGSGGGSNDRDDDDNTGDDSDDNTGDDSDDNTGTGRDDEDDTTTGDTNTDSDTGNGGGETGDTDEPTTSSTSSRTR